MRKKGGQLFLTILIPLGVVLFNLLIILFPKETIEASKQGVSLWFNNVLPSLLPFIIGTNILMGLGAVNFFGVLLEPIMYPLFGVSGSGSFALAVGLTSGYPMGAKVASELREKGELSKTEAQRLLSFCNNSGPLFILGAVATGMFSNIFAGYFIILVHYAAAITTGLLFKHYGKNEVWRRSSGQKNALRRAYYAMSDARKKDGRPLGLLLGQSVKNAMETVLQIGGFIILFCVISEALHLIGFFDFLSTAFAPFGELLGIPKALYDGIFMGIIEMTNGAKQLSQQAISKSSFLYTAAIISWGGFSIHAQAIHFISKTDLSVGVYLFSKMVHSVITILFGILLYPFFRVSLSHSVPASVSFSGKAAANLLMSSAFFGGTVVLLVGIGVVLFLYGKLRLPVKHRR